ncbi:PadR family transcriptional regulator [Nocardioides yefusunii]|uniref:PadR family transcriptional regulator n=1 Tax=Nocardioides yefusunii TaxID=2500546 RepID=A0ABW1R1A2_9ACTN|nr:PadR family transcriptional regulator [Nocardioides yefusunii]
MNTYRNPTPGRGRRGDRRRPTSPTSFGPEREMRRGQRPEHHSPAGTDFDSDRDLRRSERPGPGRGGRGRGPGGRGGRRRDVRGAVLLVLAEAPMHGYQAMQAIAERSGETWRPSPGAVYPVLAALEDEGLLTVSADSGRKVATLTEAGRAAAAAVTAGGRDPFALSPDGSGSPEASLRDDVHALVSAAKEVDRTGTPEQREAARSLLAATRRQLYGILAAEPSPTPQENQ